MKNLGKIKVPPGLITLGLFILFTILVLPKYFNLKGSGGQFDLQSLLFLGSFWVVFIIPAVILFLVIYSVIQLLRRKWTKSGEENLKFNLSVLSFLILVLIFIVLIYFK